jgi:phage FluMu gp28-like protein
MSAQVMKPTPPVLLPYQQRWIADTSPFKVAEKGRRTGLTWAEAADNVLIAASAKSAGGQNVYYVGQDKDMTEEYIDACAMWAHAFNHAAGAIEQGIWEDDGADDTEGPSKNKHILTFSIRFPKSGFRITALASRPRKLRGRQGVLVGDEAAFQDDLEGLTKAAMAFLIWGGKVRLISTHFGVDNAFNGLCNDIRSGRQKGTIHRITFRGAVEEGLYQRVCLRTGKRWAQAEEDAWVTGIYDFYRSNADEELDCVPSQSSGAYFSRALVEARMNAGLPVLRLSLPEGFDLRPEPERIARVNDWLTEQVAPLLEALPPSLASYYGMDFARSGDLSVILPLVEDALLTKWAPFIIEMRNVPFEQQKQVLFYVVDDLPNFRAGANDARGNGQYLAEVAAQKYGAEYIHRVMLTQDWYRDNMPRYKAAFEDAHITLPRDDGILNDHRAVQNVKGVPKVPDSGHTKDLKDGLGRHGDSAIAGALAWFASLNSASPIEYMSSGNERGADAQGFL